MVGKSQLFWFFYYFEDQKQMNLILEISLIINVKPSNRNNSFGAEIENIVVNVLCVVPLLICHQLEANSVKYSNIKIPQKVIV